MGIEKVGTVTLQLQLKIKAGTSTAAIGEAKSYIQANIDELPFECVMEDVIVPEE